MRAAAVPPRARDRLPLHHWRVPYPVTNLLRYFCLLSLQMLSSIARRATLTARPAQRRFGSAPANTEGEQILLGRKISEQVVGAVSASCLFLSGGADLLLLSRLSTGTAQEGGLGGHCQRDLRRLHGHHGGRPGIRPHYEY